MDLKEAKRIIAYAQKRGVKSIKMGDLEAHFYESVLLQKRRGPKIVADAPMPKIPEVPTLDQVNDYIYGTPVDEAG